MVEIPEHIKVLKPYKSGNQVGKKIDREAFAKLVNLASNENPLGASPKALNSIKEKAEKVAVYPNPAGTDLVNALAKHFNKEPEQIITGNGSDSLIADVLKAFTVEGDEVITASGTFIGTFVNVNKLNRKLVTVPLKEDYSYDLDGILNKINDKTKLIYIANPNNPTGMMISKKELNNFISKVPDNIMILLDEAYYVYSQQYEDYPNGLDYNQDNIIVLRTMSKSYGLAGLRVGFAIGTPKMIDYMYRVKLPFEPNILAQFAAVEALKDDEFIKQTVDTNNRNLEKLKKAFDDRNIQRTDGKANFIMITLDNEEMATRFASESLERGFVVRPLPMFGLPNCIRINSGTDEQTDRAIKVFNEVLDLIK